ncbi:MAG TPA: 5'-methylthioadenosine/S-adenosylhomocysteine nucleosidase [Ilumatobacter sp.]|nr:5'-methylthioadenosine/S-adenosylhomocysteine nucleosidase [Ilumatobacter sp.]
MTILYAMAVEAEYGQHLRQRFTPVWTGVGPVEAGVAVGAELAWRAAHQDLPDLVVSLGSAGSAVHPQGSVFQVASVGYRDIDASPLGFPKGRTPFAEPPGQDESGVVALPYRIPGLPEARLSSGAAVISGAEAYGAIDADLVDMETFAVLRACQRFEVPLVGLRGVSDGAADLTRCADWAEYLHVVDERLAAAVDLLDAAWTAGTLVRR